MTQAAPPIGTGASGMFRRGPGGGMSAAGPARALRYAESRQRDFLADLARFARFPSISAEPQHARDVAACAGWLAARLRSAGLDRARVVPTRGHPVVTGEWRKAPGRPTVLVYGHYDVQPPGPAAQWETPPFRPVLRGGSLHGRGTADDKGPILAHVTAMESYLRTTGRLPVNVVCVFEGEEEIGGPHLAGFLAGFGPARAVDAAVVSDTPMRRAGVPALITGLRGVLTARLRVRGPAGTCTRGISAGQWPTRSRRLVSSSPGCMTTPGGWPFPGSTTGSRPRRRASGRGRDGPRLPTPTSCAPPRLRLAGESPDSPCMNGRPCGPHLSSTGSAQAASARRRGRSFPRRPSSS